MPLFRVRVGGHFEGGSAFGNSCSGIPDLPVMGRDFLLQASATSEIESHKHRAKSTRNPAQGEKPVNKRVCGHTSSGFPALLYHLRRFFRDFVPLHDFINVAETPRNPLA